jgi:transposase
LNSRGIRYADDGKEIEFYELIRSNKPKYKMFDDDRILAEHGHVTLRLPPYHPELNAIEKIWAVVKN